MTTVYKNIDVIDEPTYESWGRSCLHWEPCSGSCDMRTFEEQDENEELEELRDTEKLGYLARHR